MSARRPLLTALGATTLLAALWFVPSANATAPPPPAGRTDLSAGSDTAGAPAPQAPLLLADSGSVDTTPYLLGGTLCLGLGAGFVTFSVRRSRVL
ncbi:hypothetical protein ABZX75_24210 [Streptomyces sp. NPDC003038]|uniref:hypothetical protein n=1 Tax=unclassified Streptomyces TaxID=2593676 RepID=UPI0033BF5D8A